MIGQVCDHALGTLTEALQEGAVLLDGTVVPMWDWRHLGTSHFSGKHHTAGFNVQFAADLDGNLKATTRPVPGARHDSAAIELAGWDKIIDAMTDERAGVVTDNAYSKFTSLATRRKPAGEPEMPARRHP